MTDDLERATLERDEARAELARAMADHEEWRRTMDITLRRVNEQAESWSQIARAQARELTKIKTERAGLVVADNTGSGLITAERQRQIEVEGYTAEHDANHGTGFDLAVAASCYATPAHLRRVDAFGVPPEWPWGVHDWKPTPQDRTRELIKAGALIAAAVDALRSSPPADIPPAGGAPGDGAE